MAREFNLSADITPATILVDLSPAFKGMPLSTPEVEVFRGDNVSINFTITQNGQPFNLAGYTVKYQAKQAIGDDSFVFDKTCTVTGAAAGTCRADLTGSDLAVAQSLTSQLYLTTPGVTQSVLQVPLLILPSI